MKIKINSKYSISLIKLNYNCLESEKNAGDHPCSNAQDTKSTKEWPNKKENLKNYSSAVKYTENIITQHPEFDKPIKSYITSSTFMTHELKLRPNMERTILGTESEYNKFIEKNNLSETRWNGKIHDDIARLDEAMKHFKLPTDMVLYSGITKEFYDIIPKESESEFECITFISTTVDESIAKSFASERKRRDSSKPKFATYLEIRAPAGSTGIATEEVGKRANPDQKWVIGKDGSQKEVILNRQQKYKIVGIEKSEKFNKIKLELI